MNSLWSIVPALVARAIAGLGCSGPVLALSVSFSEEVKKTWEPSWLAAWKAAGCSPAGSGPPPVPLVFSVAETWIVQASAGLEHLPALIGLGDLVGLRRR